MMETKSTGTELDVGDVGAEMFTGLCRLRGMQGYLAQEEKPTPPGPH